MDLAVVSRSRCLPLSLSDHSKFSPEVLAHTLKFERQRLPCTERIDVPREMVVLPWSPGVAALHDRSPACEGRIRGHYFSLTRCSQHRALGQEPWFLPHRQRTKASARYFDCAKWVPPRGKPSGPEPPLQGSHIQQAKRYHVGRFC